jgi:uncharacterized protein YidB (DUF937 family)
MGRTKETTMGLFDSLKGMAMQELQAQGPGFVNQMLANTPLAGASGLIDQLMQSGLGPQVQAMANGDQSQSISPDQLAGALDSSHIAQMAEQFGVQPDQVLSLISQHLPALAQQQQG